MFRFSLQLLSETFLLLRRIERDIMENVYWSSPCKVPASLGPGHLTAKDDANEVERTHPPQMEDKYTHN